MGTSRPEPDHSAACPDRPEPAVPDRPATAGQDRPATAPSREDHTPGRDRDSSGRPRNARARDALGRPLPPGAVGVERIPDDLVLPPAEALTEAQRLLDAGLPFHAHEVLEGTWKSAPAPERELWRGLAQLAVGLTHIWRGNPTGAGRLLHRAADRLAPYAAGPPYGIAVEGLVRWARTVAEELATDDPAAAAATVTTPRLR